MGTKNSNEDDSWRYMYSNAFCLFSTLCSPKVFLCLRLFRQGSALLFLLYPGCSLLAL